ncbi:Cell division inhibitor [Microcystis panniformis FACHB-1757]|uniref:Cell division inhibitor n=1 Tax=Microcystis panniformis FACHB-1757 TaxID=1638788 RepID=A0A0K1RU16_9CHRO|nr:Cell division inhibitor [Microcystis panniformis FACHB-1757]
MGIGWIYAATKWPMIGFLVDIILFLTIVIETSNNDHAHLADAFLAVELKASTNLKCFSILDFRFWIENPENPD